MQIFDKIHSLREFIRDERARGKRIGFVPTMGALHEGHLSLVRIAKDESDLVVLSNFVNPTQFCAGEDFEKYPRDLSRDNELCEGVGVDVVFAPSVMEMYPVDQKVWVDEEEFSKLLCGKFRLGHFRGVCTVVLKLFNIVQPDVAIFGQKDYQQYKVIERMVRQLNMSVRIICAPIVREANGLAMSSRNKYLTDEERQRASAIFAGLREGEMKLRAGVFGVEEIREGIKLRISQAGGRVEYVEIVDAENLQAFEKIPKRVLIAVAAYFGSARLIDNVVVEL